MTNIGKLLLLTTALLAGTLAAQDDSLPKTHIESESLTMRGTEDRNFFNFTENVRVTGNNLEITCEDLEVVTFRGGDPDATVGEIGSIQEVVATKNVVIEQAGRTAYCGRARFNPTEGTVLLEENPRVVDVQAEVTGWKIVIHTGERRVQVLPEPGSESDQPSGDRTRSKVTLAALPDFGFDDKKTDPSARNATADQIAPSREESRPGMPTARPSDNFQRDDDARPLR